MVSLYLHFEQIVMVCFPIILITVVGLISDVCKSNEFPYGQQNEKYIMQSRLSTDHTKDKLKRKAMKRTGWLIT